MLAVFDLIFPPILSVICSSDMLPAPTLFLQQHTEVWHLLCVGSSAYPGAEFSLYQADNDLLVASNHAIWPHHNTLFPVPVQDTSMALYQCQYSVLLKGEWSYSERSHTLAVIRGNNICLNFTFLVWSHCWYCLAKMWQLLFLNLAGNHPPKSTGSVPSCHMRFFFIIHLSCLGCC